jgi:hypothetical protein
VRQWGSKAMGQQGTGMVRQWVQYCRIAGQQSNGIERPVVQLGYPGSPVLAVLYCIVFSMEFCEGSLPKFH